MKRWKWLDKPIGELLGITPPPHRRPVDDMVAVPGTAADPEPEIDGDDPTAIHWPGRQAHAFVPFEVVNGRPVNPSGLAGKPGRGELWLWGENKAADPIVFADGRVLLIQRDDCGDWAIPGGMVDPGELAPDTLIRELREETGVDLHDMVPQIITRTYVADPRNTSEAWIASTVALFKLDQQPPAKAGSDATDAGWFRFGSLDELARDVKERTGGELYAPHRVLLQAALDAMGVSIALTVTVDGQERTFHAEATTTGDPRGLGTNLVNTVVSDARDWTRTAGRATPDRGGVQGKATVSMLAMVGGQRKVTKLSASTAGDVHEAAVQLVHSVKGDLWDWLAYLNLDNR